MYYNADNQPFVEPLRLNGKQIFNPSAAQLEAAGYHEVQPTATAISADEREQRAYCTCYQKADGHVLETVQAYVFNEPLYHKP